MTHYIYQINCAICGMTADSHEQVILPNEEVILCPPDKLPDWADKEGQKEYIHSLMGRQVVLCFGNASQIKTMIKAKATGREIKQRAMDIGIPIKIDYQLLGYNANGTNSVIGNNDIPWQEVFEFASIYDNA